MPINVRPEFMEAAEEHLKEFDPSTEWKDSALTLAVAAFGQKCFDIGDIDVGSVSEAEQLAEHCRVNHIKGHSINADGSCNMGCCGMVSDSVL